MIKIISETEYKQLQYPILFCDEQTDRSFAILSFQEDNYKIAWQSNNITPCIVKIQENIFAIGVDQNFIIMDFKLQKIRLKYKLDYFVYDIQLYEDFIYVITELEILKIKIETMTLISRNELPDFLENIKFEDKQIIIECMNGKVITL